MQQAGQSCPQCRVALSPGANFCPGCGCDLRCVCSQCAAKLLPDCRFCSECGAQQAEASESAGVEIRQITVLFVDLVGSTSLAAAIDLEDYRELLAGYLEVVESVVGTYEGYVAQYLGDGAMVYFGYPVAHEEDSRRACLAAIEIIERMRRVSVEVGGTPQPLAVRAGVHTGDAVVGGLGSSGARETMAVGETTNIAARLQELAPVNTALMSAATARLVRGAVACRSWGRTELRGVTPALEVYQILGREQELVELSVPGDGMQMVGRELELQVLSRAWSAARSGSGRVVALTAEAGMGKSRLVQAFLEAEASDARILHCRTPTFQSDTPLAPVASALRRLLDFRPEAGDDGEVARLEGLLQELGIPLADRVPLLGSVLGLPIPEQSYAPLELAPALLRSRTLDVLVELFVALGRRLPLVLIMEDLQWADATTLTLMDRLSEIVYREPVLLLLAGRPPFQLPPVVDEHLVLSRMSRAELARLVRNVAQDAELSSGVTTRIVEKADGNPFYAAELTRSMLEATSSTPGAPAGAPTPGPRSVPSSLQELILARLDHASRDRTVIHAAAVIGRTFSYEVLRGLLPEQPNLSGWLDRYIRGGILSVRGTPPEATYTFCHQLFREVAYGSIVRSARRRLHAQVAALLQSIEGEVQPEVMAWHLTEGDQRLQAVHWWARAGAHALETFALDEALRHLERGLELLPARGDPQSSNAEVELRATLGVVLMLLHGFASEQAGRNYEQLFDACLRMEDSSSGALFPAYWGLWTYHIVGARYREAEDMGRRLLELAGQMDDGGVRLGGHVAFGAARLMQGDLEGASDHLEQGLARYAARHRALANLFGQDAGAMCCSFLTWVHAHRGEDAKAHERAAQALQMCDALLHAPTRCFVESVVATCMCLLGQYEAGERHSRKVADLGDAGGMPHWAAQGRFTLGWALQGQGRPEEALEHMSEGERGFARTGTKAALSYFVGALAEAHLKRRDLPGAEATLQRALDFVSATGERLFEPEILRLQAEFALAAGGPDAVARAEQLLVRAAQLARRQGAHRFEQRALASLENLSRQHQRT